MPMQLAANVLDGIGRGIGDVEIGYSYFLLGNNDTRVTISPGVSLILPTGNVGKGKERIGDHPGHCGPDRFRSEPGQPRHVPPFDGRARVQKAG